MEGWILEAACRPIAVALAVGDVVVSKRVVHAAHGSGYLSIPGPNVLIDVLHIGSSGDEVGWLYARQSKTSHGWISLADCKPISAAPIVGDVVVSKHAVHAVPGSGYLSVQATGEQMKILHVGVDETDEEGWLFAQLCGKLETTGCMSVDNVREYMPSAVMTSRSTFMKSDGAVRDVLFVSEHTHECTVTAARDCQVESEFNASSSERVADVAALVPSKPVASKTDFDVFLTGFFYSYCEAMLVSLDTVLDNCNLTRAPLAAAVKSKFMDMLRHLDNVSLKVDFAFHGTEQSKLESIYERGLLVPGTGSGIAVANGSAHGVGIYLANKDAPWLAAGFCRGNPQMLVCAVLQSDKVNHHGDAQVVFDSSHVIPLLVATGRSSKNGKFDNPSEFSRMDERPLAMAAIMEAGEAALINGKKVSLHMVGARRLKKIGFTARRLKYLGFDATEVRDIGFTDLELRFADYDTITRHPECHPHSWQDDKTQCIDALELSEEQPRKDSDQSVSKTSQPAEQRKSKFSEISVERRVHPVLGLLTFKALQKMVPTSRCLATWLKLRVADASH